MTPAFGAVVWGSSAVFLLTLLRPMGPAFAREAGTTSLHQLELDAASSSPELQFDAAVHETVGRPATA